MGRPKAALSSGCCCSVHERDVLSGFDAMAQDKYGGKEHLLADMKQPPSVGGLDTVDPLVETLVGYPLPGRQGLPLVEEWDCLRVSSNALPVSREALMAVIQYHA